MSVVFAILLFSLLLFLAAFAVSSARERETRALAVSLLLLFIATAIFIVWAMSPTYGLWHIGGALALVFVPALVLPWKRPAAIQKAASPERYDERDIMFSRARYAPGSAAYTDYYQRRPEKKEADDAIRAMPDLLAPGGREYEPTAARQAAAHFETIEQWTTLVDGPVSDQKAELPPDEIFQMLQSMARSLGVVDCASTRLQPYHFYTHYGRGPDGYGTPIESEHTHVFVFAVEMDWWAVQQAPKMPVVVESSKQYLEAAKIGLALAQFLRAAGFAARTQMDMNYQTILPAVAHDAGLGEISRMGYLLHPEFGGRIRLGAVTTTAPLPVMGERRFGVQDFCRVCKKCARVCPSGAISFGEEKEIRGVRKWSTNQEACFRFWRTVGTDCALCMRVCPYSKVNSLPHKIIRLLIRQNSLARRLAVWGDGVFYGKK